MTASTNLYTAFFKRAIDFTAALFGLILLSPLLLILIVLLALANSGKPFFFQARPGRGGKVFNIVKFKTMNDAKNPDGSLKSDAERLTPVGAFVRSTSLDELPQLVNVLKGEMSLIGPRPLLVSYLPLYNEQEMLRQSVRPGITGLAGVMGRNNISWYDKMFYDIQYVRDLSFMSDMRIALKTVGKVLARDGVAKDGHATTDTFADFCRENPVRTYNV